MSPAEPYSLAELRSLVERYALAVDRADAAAVAALFTTDGELALFMNPADDNPTGLRRGREQIETAVATIARYDATHHTISSSSASPDGDAATGETRCEAHHVARDTDRVLFLHYLDSYRRVDGEWFFSRRDVHARWATTLPADRGGLG